MRRFEPGSSTTPVALAALAGPISRRFGAGRAGNGPNPGASSRILPDSEISSEFATKTKAKHIA